MLRKQGEADQLASIDTSKPWSPDEFRAVLSAFEKSVVKLQNRVESGEPQNGKMRSVQGLKGIPYMPADFEEEDGETGSSGKSKGKNTVEGKLEPGAGSNNSSIHHKKNKRTYGAQKKVAKKVNKKVAM